MPATGYKSQGAGADHTTSGHAKPTGIPPTASCSIPVPPEAHSCPHVQLPAFSGTRQTLRTFSSCLHNKPPQAHIPAQTLPDVLPGSGLPIPAVFQLTPAQTCADFWGVPLGATTHLSHTLQGLCDIPSQEAACSQLNCKPCQFHYLHQNT